MEEKNNQSKMPTEKSWWKKSLSKKLNKKESIKNEAVYRTAPATPGVLITPKKYAILISN